jgi:inosine-uridine nucleoside N-ribohydrolase
MKFLFFPPYRYLLIFFLACLLSCGSQPAEPAAEAGAAPVPIILDTDFGPDYDDVGALALLHALADSGEARILAVVASCADSLVAPSIDVVNTWFGHPDLPVGAPRGEAVNIQAPQNWPDTLVARFPHDLKSNAAAEAAVDLYRRTLAEAADSSVTIVTVGFLTNLANLLQSPPDEWSPLAGRALVAQKVRHLVTMGGRFPEGKEFNLDRDPAATRYVVEHWPTPILFSGFEIGWEVITGKRLVAERPADNPVREVYRICMNYAEEDRAGRQSWDQTAVLVAVRGHEPYFGVERGRIVVDSTGYNTWEAGPGPHRHLTFRMPVPELTREIEQLMMHQP